MIGIEIIASVNRENAIFLTGETAYVLVTLRNTVQIGNSLAWGCVQLHCDQIQGKEEKQKPTDSVTSLSHGKTALYSSKPMIIFCDIKLNSGELLEYSGSFEIPAKLPPSFKGSFVKYSWYVTVAVQHVDAPFKLLQLPLRVLNFNIPIEMPLNTAGNPFLAQNYKQQVTIRLETIEEDLQNDKNVPNVTTHAVKYVVTMFMQDCQCILSIPGNAVPAFTTDVVCLRWRLHFDFLVSNGSPIDQSSIGCSTIKKELQCEKIPWDHYIQVHACNPFNVNLACPTSISSVTENV
uniref:Uncharacterized protein n=1 Tax=Panagrolaimus sp. ES5 TaxID=591445 RepID=A0AC34FM11_9BILA